GLSFTLPISELTTLNPTAKYSNNLFGSTALVSRDGLKGINPTFQLLHISRNSSWVLGPKILILDERAKPSGAPCPIISNSTLGRAFAAAITQGQSNQEGVKWPMYPTLPASLLIRLFLKLSAFLINPCSTALGIT